MISDDDIKRARELSALLTNGSELPASVWALQDERFSAGKVIDASWPSAKFSEIGARASSTSSQNWSWRLMR